MSRMASRWVSVLLWVGACLAPAAGMLGASAPPIVEFSTRHGKSARLRDHRPNGPVRARRPAPDPEQGSGEEEPVSPIFRFGPRGAEAVRPLAARSLDPVRRRSPTTTTPRSSDSGSCRRTPKATSARTTTSSTSTTSPRSTTSPATSSWDPFAGQRLLGRPRRPLRGSERRRPARRATTARPIAGSFRSSRFPTFPDGPFYQCIAVSTTNDPTGDYYQYEFKTSDDFFTDYGKIGIWPDAYYMSFNMFGPNGEVAGRRLRLRPRRRCSPAPEAGMIIFDTGGQVGVLPSDLDGPTPPPAGSPNYFMTFDVNPARLLAVAVPRRLDDARQQHVHRPGRDPGGRVHLSRLRRPNGGSSAFPSSTRRRSSRPSATA